MPAFRAAFTCGGVVFVYSASGFRIAFRYVSSRSNAPARSAATKSRTNASTGASRSTSARSSRWKRRATSLHSRRPAGPGVVLRAAGRGARNLRHEAARGDLLERERQVARASELALDPAGAIALELAPEALARGARLGVARGRDIDEEGVGVPVD